MLWIISVSKTVLPTPAPPNSPALPPRSSGTSTSMTLMPVSKTWDLLERLAKAGGSRWMVRHSTSDGAGWRSMALPNTSNIRERMLLPTGTFNGPPVSSTAMPRASPLRGTERDSADMMDIKLHQNLNGNTRLLPCAKQRVDGRQGILEPHIDHASTHRPDHAVIRVPG